MEYYQIMKSLSDLLQFYLTTKDINISEAARACDLDRANMHKIFYGKRKLSSPETAEKLVLYLKLSPQEEEEFREAYYYSLDGYDIYLKRRMVEDFFADLEVNIPLSHSSLPKIRFEGRGEEALSSVSSITGYQDIQYTALWILLKELAKPVPNIRIVSAAENDDMLVTLLSSCLAENNKARIQHIFRMRGRFLKGEGKKNVDKYNFNFLSTVFTLCVGTYNYSPHYFYISEEVSLKKSPLPIYQYLLSTSDHILELSQDYQHALMINDRKVLETDNDWFDQCIRKTKSLIKINKDLSGLFTSIHTFSKENTNIYNFDMEPCVVSFITQDIIERNLKQDYVASSRTGEMVFRYFSDDTSSFLDRVVLYVMSEDGLRRFLETGMLSDLPQELYTPLPMEDRLYLVRMYIQKLASRTLLLYHDLYDYRKIVTFYVGDKSCQLYYRMDNISLYNFYINEESICGIFRSFAEHLPKHIYYPPEETEAQLRRILHEYE